MPLGQMQKEPSARSSARVVANPFLRPRLRWASRSRPLLVLDFSFLVD